MRYQIERKAGQVVVTFIDGMAERAVPHVVRHSPTGMEYGYGGSGPSDLALSIMTHYFTGAQGITTENQATIEAVYQGFKWPFISALDGDVDFHVIESEDIYRWLYEGPGWELVRGVLEPQRPWHAHYGGESADCDGRYNHGHDQPSNPGEDKHDFIARVWAWAYHSPDGSDDVHVVISTDSEDRIEINFSRRTEEGFERGAWTICDQDDFDEGYSGYRDHTAEAAGY